MQENVCYNKLGLRFLRRKSDRRILGRVENGKAERKVK
jgi:hypothetical protein